MRSELDQFFGLHADFWDSRTLNQAQAVATAARTAISTWIQPRESTTPLELHLYRTPTTYHKAERKLTSGAFARNLAFSHFETETAHVALQPEVNDSILAELGPTTLTLRLIAHEAAHLVRYRSLPNHRSHPRWLADGIATWTGIQALRAIGRLASLESSPSFCRHLHDVQRVLAERRMPPADQIVRGGHGSLTFHETYAVHWLLFDWLARSRPRAFREWLAGMVVETPGGRGYAERIATALFADVVAIPIAEFDEEIAAAAHAFVPKWEERSRTLDTAGTDWTQAAFDTSDAECWRVNPAIPPSWTLRGQVTIHDAGEHDQLHILLGRSDQSRFVVTFVGGRGIGIMDHEAREDSWTTLHWQAMRMPLHTDIPFVLRIQPNDGRPRLTLEVDGGAVCEVTLDRAIDRAWGLGARRGSVGVWHNVQFTEA